MLPGVEKLGLGLGIVWKNRICIFCFGSIFVVSNHTTPEFKLRLSAVLSKMASDPVCYAIIIIGTFVEGIKR